MTSTLRITLAAALLGAAASIALAAGGHVHVARRIAIGGEGGWDALAVDAVAHRLFVTHGTHVQVVDLARDRVVGDIPDTPGVHGVALATDLGRGFTSNGRDSSVTVFDLKTLAVLDRIHLPGRNPDAIEYDPETQRVFAFNAGSGTVTAIAGATDRIVGTLPLDGRPEFAAADDHGRMYVNLEDSSAVLALDTRALRVLHRWPLAPGEAPTGLALDRRHRRLFSGCGNGRLVVLDADDGRVVAVLPIGQGVDGVAFDAARARAISSNGEGTLTVIHEDDPEHFRVVENAPTQRGARTLALDPASGTVYTPTAAFGPPPAPTPERPHPRPSIVPGTFVVLVARD
jgi:DNA-binding beta-propeller fold protein YncE